MVLEEYRKWIGYDIKKGNLACPQLKFLETNKKLNNN